MSHTSVGVKALIFTQQLIDNSSFVYPNGSICKSTETKMAALLTIMKYNRQKTENLSRGYLANAHCAIAEILRARQSRDKGCEHP